VGGTAQEAVVSANGSTLYVPTEGGDLAIFDLSSGTQQQSIPNGGGFGAALTPDGLQLWVVTGNQLKMVDLATRGVQTVSVPGNARRIVFSSDHSTAIVTLETSALAFIR
jgi:DNA-binding beta-propeller fold protein YncE